MFTLMPVAAFAADTLTISQKDGALTIAGGTDKGNPYFSTDAGATWNKSSLVFDADGEVEITAANVEADVTANQMYALDDTGKGAVKVTTAMINAAKTANDWAAWTTAANATAAGNAYDALTVTYEASKGAGIETDAAEAAKVMGYTKDQAVAYWTGNTTSSLNHVKSTFATVKTGLELDKNEFGKAVITLKNSNDAAGSGYVYIWAEEVTDVASAALMVAGYTATNNIYEINVADTEEIEIGFTTSGTYNLKAAYRTTQTPPTDLKAVTGEITVPTGYNTVVVEADDLDSSKFEMTAAFAGVAAPAKVADENTVGGNITVDANGVDEEEVTLTFEDENDNPVVGYTVNIDTNSSAVDVSAKTLTTNYKGEVTFDVSGVIEGDYEIFVTCEDFEATIKVTVGSTAAAFITTKAQPAAPQALYGSLENDDVTFSITDINRNAVDETANEGMDGIFGRDGLDRTKYVVLTEKPEKSDLKSKDLRLVSLGNGEWGLDGVDKDAEGTYAVKVILDNGAVATAKWEVKKFGTPVNLMIVTAPVVELGRSLSPEMYLVDANNVVKQVYTGKDVTLAATGYAINSFDGYTIEVKTDEKYAGSVINLTAVSEKYDLVGTATVTVAAEATDIEFEDKALDVNVNNKVAWSVVDVEGNEVRLTDVTNCTIKYVVLDKPEGAKVSVYDLTPTAFTGDNGEMSVTSNMVGNVTIQAVAQVQFDNNAQAATGAAGTNATATVTKYYTGTKVFAVGTAGTGDVVVMSVGSNEIVINDAKSTIDAEPIVANNRTFVPFRALAEAFGATVAYDEATQAVTAELEGTTVVMTIGSATYTVNGAEATADVAPFINGSRTMVPVRFVAEAFGINVIPTYNPDGTTADVLFVL